MSKDYPKRKRNNRAIFITSPYFNKNKHENTVIDKDDITFSSESALDKDTSSKSVVDPCSTLNKSKGIRLSSVFFDIPCVNLAKALLGKYLVRRCTDGTVFKGRIVETESYPGGDDKASISYGGKITEKSQPMYMKPGTTFVYLTYGMYNLINISSKGDGAAVLLRALEPIEGIERMEKNRNMFQPNKNKAKIESKAIPFYNLCNGPAKLCISLNIRKHDCNKQDLSTWNEMWVESGDSIPEDNIVKCSRIGIDSAGPEWASKLLRFYILNNKCVSKRDKHQEAFLNASL